MSCFIPLLHQNGPLKPLRGPSLQGLGPLTGTLRALNPPSWPTSLFIREYLLSHGEGYALEIWRELKKARGGFTSAATTASSGATCTSSRNWG